MVGAASCCGDVFQRQGLVRIEGKMNRAKYTEIHYENLLRTSDWGEGSQDNDQQHTAKTTQKWLRDKSLNIIDWPNQRLDLNPT